MTDFSDEYTEQEVLDHVDKFNRAIQSGDICYFDVIELERVIDYFMSKDKLEMATRAIEMGLKVHPDSLSLKMCAASILAENGELKRALELADEVASIESSNDEIFLLKASIYAQLHQHNKAISQFHKALHLNSDNRDQILLDIAYEQQNLGKYDDAIRTLRHALKTNPDNEAALHEISYSYEMAEKTEGLIRFMTNFLDNQPYSYAGWYNLGNAYYKLESYKECISAYEFCLAIEEHFTPALYNKANALVQLGKYREAIAHFNDLAEIEGDHASIYCYIGECFEKLEDNLMARKNYEQALKLDIRCAEAYIGLGVLLDLEGRHFESLDLYKKALDLDAECCTYWHLYALAAQEINDLNVADSAFQKALKLDEHQPQVWEDYATFLVYQGKTEEAINLLTEGYINNDKATDFLYRMAWYNCELNYPIDAEDLLYLAVQQDPEGLPRFLKNFPEAKNNPLMIDFIRSGNFN